ncbi:hypothetical protein [Roseimarinus sediminis]|uniref:hypothetical protein n=1 Tax=Roseimarinus sediminis TaxID=1610899 RepID=UPI003D1FD4ED
MKKQIGIIIIIIGLYIFISCNKADLSTSGLKFVKENYPLIPIENLELAVKDTMPMVGVPHVGLVYVDTIDGLKAAQLSVDYFPEKDSFVLYGYDQHWIDGKNKYYLRIKNDTTGFFRENLETNEIFFYIGEYAFQRTQNEVALKAFGDTTVKDEIIYYDLHRDSLRKVRGNKLPPLPAPTEEERKRWEEMQNE